MAFNAAQAKRLKEATQAQLLLNSICSDNDLAAALRPVANTVASLIARLHASKQAAARAGALLTPPNMRVMTWSIAFPAEGEGVADEGPNILIWWSDPYAVGRDADGTFSFPMSILTDDAAFASYVQNFESEIRANEEALYDAEVASKLSTFNRNRGARQSVQKATAGGPTLKAERAASGASGASGSAGGD